MKKIVLIGNIGNPNSGPGYVIKSIKEYLEEKKYDYEVIDICKNKIKILFSLLKILRYKETIINVHSFGYKIPYIVMLISKINKKNNYYLTLHGIMSIENEINGLPYSKKIENKIFQGFPNIICVSDYEKNILIKKFNRKENIFVCNNGCDFYGKEYKDKNSDENGVITFIDAGGINKRKNALEVIKIINELNKNGIKCKYEIYGTISDKLYYEECKKYTIDNNIDNLIHYKGKIDRKELEKVYINSTYCIALSKFDTFNMSLLEAMQTGTPIILSENTGISTIISNENVGLIVKDNYSIKDIVTFFKENEKENKYKRLCENAYRIGNKYSSYYMNSQYMKVFGEENNE